jgi:hypothetical protein
MTPASIAEKYPFFALLLSLVLAFFALAGACLIFSRTNLDEKWAAVITIVVVISVLLYMDLLVRRNRNLATKRHHARAAAGKRGNSTIEDRDLSVDVFDEIR